MLATESDAPLLPPEIHAPFTAKQPLVRLNPFVAVEVAVPVRLNAVAEIPPPKVEVAVPVTARFVVVAFVVVLLVNVTFVAVIVVDVRSAMVATAELMALDMLPIMEDAEIEPPVMVGFVIVVLARLSIRCDSATAL